MQKFRMLQGQENVKNSREAINENFIAVASNFSGEAFPTSNLYVGMKFYHTGEQKTYTLRQVDPVRWDEDTSGKLKNARDIKLTGKVKSETISFDGTSDVAINVINVEADVCNGNAASATVAASVKGAISSQNAPRHVWFSGVNNEQQREYANNFTFNPVSGTLTVPRLEGTASTAVRAYTSDKAVADGNGGNIAETYAPKNGAGASGTWGINIGGRAAIANVADRVGNDAADMRFHWSGQGGQPTWVWGGNGPSDTQVYNPANFNVNHANTANRASNAGWADGAQRAKSAERADGAGWADNAGRVGGKTIDDIRNESSRIIILSGTIRNGEYIPLPSGYEESQCKWIVSIANDNPSNAPWDIPEAGTWLHYKYECYTEGRKVICHTYLGHQPRRREAYWVDSIANYMIIGVK